MRQDPQVHSFIRAAREREKHSACCVRNDRSGCVQTSEEECSVRAPPAAALVRAPVTWSRRWSPASFTLGLGTWHHPLGQVPQLLLLVRPLTWVCFLCALFWGVSYVSIRGIALFFPLNNYKKRKFIQVFITSF